MAVPRRLPETGGTLLIRRIDGKTSSAGIYIYRRMGKRVEEDVYVAESWIHIYIYIYIYTREIDWRVCIMRSSWRRREAAKKLFPGENSDFDRSPL